MDPDLLFSKNRTILTKALILLVTPYLKQLTGSSFLLTLPDLNHLYEISL